MCALHCLVAAPPTSVSPGTGTGTCHCHWHIANFPLLFSFHAHLILPTCSICASKLAAGFPVAIALFCSSTTRSLLIWPKSTPFLPGLACCRYEWKYLDTWAIVRAIKNWIPSTSFCLVSCLLDRLHSLNATVRYPLFAPASRLESRHCHLHISFFIILTRFWFTLADFRPFH